MAEYEERRNCKLTDNEKRAHDLAIATIPVALDQIKAQAKSGEEIKVHMEDLYFNLYQDYLKKMNELFSDNQ